MKILFFYPENPLENSQGNNARAFQLLQYFKDRKILVDFIGEDNNLFSQKDIESLKQKKLINEVCILPNLKRSGLNYLFKVSLPKAFSSIPKPFDRRRFKQQDIFNNILKSNTYDYVIISYTCWIPLILNNNYLKGAKTIVDTHDFLTSQFKRRKDFNLGKFFKAEMTLLDSVDQVWSISVEEKYLFEQFISKPVFLVPHITQSQLITSKKTIDILYVASNNMHNIIAINWFFENVYGMLIKDINITIVGKINNHINTYPNVQKISYVEDLTQLYGQSKVVISPMLTGTGLKIKVAEALSYGIPVVCNTRGVDGLINKTENGCLVTDSPQHFAENIHRLLEDEKFYNDISQKAKSYHTNYLSEDAIYSKLDSILD